jgi:hypothetical protein
MASASAAPLSPLTGPVADDSGLLSRDAEADIRRSAEAFRKATGRWLVVMALRDRAGVDLSSLPATTAAQWVPGGAGMPIGIVYVMTPGERSGTLTVVDPDWKRVSGHPWIPMFALRLAEKYGDEPFERRAVLSAQYLADVFPDKIAFLMQPADVIPPESIEDAERIMTVVKWFVYFIILFTFYRTIFPARLTDKDTDAFSNELRKLKKERQIW